MLHLVPSWHGHAPHSIVGLFVGECEGTTRFAQGYTIKLGFLLYGHGKPISKNIVPPLVLGIPELEIFTGLGFHVALGYSAFGVYVLIFSGFKWTLIERFGICLGRGYAISCNGSIAHSLPLTF